jgi:hypothetical protein
MSGVGGKTRKRWRKESWRESDRWTRDLGIVRMKNRANDYEQFYLRIMADHRPCFPPYCKSDAIRVE